MSNDEIAAAFQEIYNGFWLKCRNRKNSAEDFERIVNEAERLLKKYPFKLAQDMILNFLDELDARERRRNGKTR